VLAESIAVVVVTLAVLGPGSYLLHVAWRRGGTPRKVALATLIAMFALVACTGCTRNNGREPNQSVRRRLGPPFHGRGSRSHRRSCAWKVPRA